MPAVSLHPKEGKRRALSFFSPGRETSAAELSAPPILPTEEEREGKFPSFTVGEETNLVRKKRSSPFFIISSRSTGKWEKGEEKSHASLLSN